MTRHALIAGAGIGGLAAALALKNQGWSLQILEQSARLSEVGAGLQLGPNVTRILQAWGLEKALQECAAEPQRLVARHALHGHELGVLPLGQDMQRRWGAPYLTVHRADLHQVLLQALLQALDTSALMLNQKVIGVEAGQCVKVRTATHQVEAPLLIAADGLWSEVRTCLWADAAPQPTGHVAYRALLNWQDVPEAMRASQVTVWLGPALHVVQYPVRAGQAMNVVVIAHVAPETTHAPQDWDSQRTAQHLGAATNGVCAPLRGLLDAVSEWRRWDLYDRASLQGPQDMARDNVALLGDAAHPMRPYLAQGAGMAIEDAQALATCLSEVQAQHAPVAHALQRYAQERWQRNARVQARARRNGMIFHLPTPWSLARDLALRLAAPSLMNLPWLYGYQRSSAGNTL